MIGGAVEELPWPPMIDPRQEAAETMDVERLGEVWRGAGDEYGEAAVIGAVAIALHAMGIAPDPASAEAEARRLWSGRNRARLLAA